MDVLLITAPDTAEEEIIKVKLIYNGKSCKWKMFQDRAQSTLALFAAILRLLLNTSAKNKPVYCSDYYDQAEYKYNDCSNFATDLGSELPKC